MSVACGYIQKPSRVHGQRGGQRLPSRSPKELLMRTSRLAIVLVVAILASLASVSAHLVKGLGAPDLATAFVSSPSAGTDAPVRVAWGTQDTGLRVVCFNVANTSPERADRPGWPRVTGVGFELPGKVSGFSLVAPIDGDWELVENTRAFLPEHGTVALDLAIVARMNLHGRQHGRPQELRGIPPGQLPNRNNGTRFCVSGPFPDELVAGQATTIEQIINGVVVGFHGVDGQHFGFDAGVWFPTLPNTTGPGPDPRAIPLYE